MADRNYKIYALFDPVSGEAFYVGRTSKNLTARLKRYLEDSGNRTPKGQKIREIEKKYDTPFIGLLEKNIGSEKEAYIKEVFWMEMFTKSGFELTNASVDFDGHFFLRDLPNSDFDADDNPIKPEQKWSIELDNDLTWVESLVLEKDFLDSKIAMSSIRH